MVLNVAASLLSRPHSSGGGEGGIVGALIGGLFALVICAFIYLVFAFILSKIFVKAGRPALAAYVPFWNLIVILEMAGKPWWWLFLYFIPLVGIVVSIVVHATLFERFGMESPISWILAIGMLVFPVIGFVLLIWGAFGNVTYREPGVGVVAPAY